ncbi:hypothetical protein R3Q08_26840 [Rhodococcus erythropolis]|uniref:hypothetical protein n=1 Tax=Rhodococcus erythropolis TaxID=1833 RepID=UPI002949D027|nr:hypothetical protein [Rhodococcus erythropolis]MDV6211882.1 hypothetical protein [Rhodococcus erythropolis]
MPTTRRPAFALLTTGATLTVSQKPEYSTEPIPGLPTYLTFLEIKHRPNLAEIFRQATEEVAERTDPETIATRIKGQARFANSLFEKTMNYRYITQSGDSLISASQLGWINIIPIMWGN